MLAVSAGRPASSKGIQPAEISHHCIPIHAGKKYEGWIRRRSWTTLQPDIAAESRGSKHRIISIQRSKTDQKGCWGIRKRATRQGDDGRAVTLRSPTHVGCPVTVLCYGTLVSPCCGTVHGSSHTTQGNFCSFPRSFSFLKHRTNDSNNAQQTYTLRLNRGWGIRPPWKWRLFRLEHVLFLHKPTRSSRENQF